MHRALSACAVLAFVALTACDKSSSSSDGTTSASAAAPLTAGSGGEHERGRPGPGGPGGEMFEACAGKTAGTACTVKMRDKEMTGTCAAPPNGPADAKLMCKPDNMPPPPAGSGAPAGPPH